MHKEKFIRVIPVALAGLSLIAWVFSSFLDDKAQGLSRSLSEARSEARRAYEVELLLERFTDLRERVTPSDAEAQCVILLDKTPKIRQGDTREELLRKDSDCQELVLQAKAVCGAADKRRELRVRAAQYLASVMRQLLPYLDPTDETNQHRRELIKRVESASTKYEAARDRFIGTFGRLSVRELSPSAKNCNLLIPFRKNRQEAIEAWR